MPKQKPVLKWTLIAVAIFHTLSAHAGRFDDLTYSGGSTIESPLDVSQFSTNETNNLIALRFLRTFVGKDGFQVIKDSTWAPNSADTCFAALGGNAGSDVFEKKRSAEYLKQLIEKPDGPAAQAAAAKYIQIDVTDWLDKEYDFNKSCFNLNRSKTGPLSSKTGGLGDPFYISTFQTEAFPVAADVAEKWIKSSGRLFAICELGKFATRQGDIPLCLKSKCVALRLVSGSGDVLASNKDIVYSDNEQNAHLEFDSLLKR